MAKYFGHRTKWAGGTKGSNPQFGQSQGGPPATTNGPNPYNTYGGGQSGQIIPPNRGQYPRGKSLPGYGTPRSMTNPWGARAQALGRLGKLGGRYFNLPFLLQDFMTVAEWFSADEPVDPTSDIDFASWSIPGYTSQCTPAANMCGGSGTGVFWGYGGSFGPILCNECINFPLAYTWPQVQALAGPPGVLGVGYRRRLTSHNPRHVWSRTGTALQTPWPPTVVKPRTITFAPTAAPPKPEHVEKRYPASSTRVEPRARYFGPRLPPRGTTKYPEYPHVPPPPRVKEKKGLVIGPGKAGKVYGAVTEFRDFADCLAKSMPGNPCSKYKNQLHKYVACIAMNEAKINMPEAMVCMFTNDAQDSVIGKSNRMAREAATGNPYWKRPVGPGAGAWARPRSPGKMTPI